MDDRKQGTSLSDETIDLRVEMTGRDLIVSDRHPTETDGRGRVPVVVPPTPPPVNRSPGTGASKMSLNNKS